MTDSGIMHGSKYKVAFIVLPVTGRVTLIVRCTLYHTPYEYNLSVITTVCYISCVK